MTSSEPGKARHCSQYTTRRKARLRRLGPPAGYPSDDAFVKGNAFRGFDPFDYAVERRASSYTLEFALHARHSGSQGGHSGGVLGGEGMDEQPRFVRRFAFVLRGLHFYFSFVSLVLAVIRHWRHAAFSTKPPEEVEFEAGQWCADLMHRTTRYERPEVDRGKSSAVDQLDHSLFGFGVVAGCKDDGTRFVGREVLYPGHRDVADRFYKPCANRHLSDNLARRTPLQCRARSCHAGQTNVWGLQMCVRRIDQDAASPINTLESVSYTDPMRGKNDDVAFGCLMLRPGDGAWTEISDKISECLRTSGV
jgi:hypothetical protein